MKKIIYLLIFVTVFFASCNPMDEVYEELGSQEQVIAGDANFTMNDDDYGNVGNDDVKKNKSFVSYEQAESLIPMLLTSKYPVWGEKSSAKVSFAIDRLNYLKDKVSYEVSDSDYQELGYRYGNFSSSGHMLSFLKWKYPNATRGTFVELTYKYYNGSVSTLTENFVYTDEWIATKTLGYDDYRAMEQRYSNFSKFSDAEFLIGRYLGTLSENAYAKEGDVKNVIYTYTYKNSEGVRKFKDVLVAYTFKDGVWMLNSNTIQFGHNGTKWEKDNTIKYTLTNADYALVGNDRYNNFDVRSGKGEETVEARLAKINTILLNNFPDAAEGQKYLVSYNIYNGSNDVWQMSVIKQGSEYILNE